LRDDGLWLRVETGSYLRLIDFVYHSTLGLRVIKKSRRRSRVYGLVGVGFGPGRCRHDDLNFHGKFRV